MMRDTHNGPAIVAECISLGFRRKSDRPTTIKELMMHKLLRRHACVDIYWALNDVSFVVQPGERLGVIGLNGSGKTSLLSLIAGIYPPDKGTITTRGRIVGLLGLGVGFDPEMTGRENIPLNAALFGLSKQEIEKKMDDIIAFADIGEFIDSPVRTYSSGMVARLGFAVAAHLDADIILLDEILAVGDATFRQKCMDRMQALREAGKTMVFVAHEMQAVRAMCHRVIWLEKGKIVMQGDVTEVVDAYEDKYDPNARIQTRG